MSEDEDEYMNRDKYFVPKKEWKRDYHEFTGVPKSWEIIFKHEYDEDADTEVNEWQSRFH